MDLDAIERDYASVPVSARELAVFLVRAQYDVPVLVARVRHLEAALSLIAYAEKSALKPSTGQWAAGCAWLQSVADAALQDSSGGR